MEYKYKKTQLFAKRLDIPKDVQDRIYRCNLSLREYVQYELNGKIPTSCLMTRDRLLLEKFGFEKVRTLDFDLIGRSMSYNIKDLYKVLEDLEYIPDNLNHYLYELVADDLYLESYTEGMRVYFSDRFFNMEEVEEDKKEVVTNFLSNRISLSDILFNWDLFKDKDLDYFLKRDYSNRDYNLRTKNIHRFMEQYGSLFNLIFNNTDVYKFISEVTDLSKSEESIHEYVKDFLENVLKYSKAYQTELTNEEYRLIFKYIDLEAYIESISTYSGENIVRELKQYDENYLYNLHIPVHVLLDSYVLKLMSFYGVKNIIDFDKECGFIFSKNNYALLKKWWEMYLHYANNNHDPESMVTTKKIESSADFDRPYTKYEFFESVRRCLKFGPNAWEFAKLSPNFSSITGEFRNIYPELFLGNDADIALQNLFYSRELDCHHLHDNPSYREYLRGKDLTASFKRKEVRVEPYNYISLYEYLENRFSYDEMYDFVSEYHNVIETVFKYNVLADSYRWNIDYFFGETTELDYIISVLNKAFIIAIEEYHSPIPKEVPITTRNLYPNMFLGEGVPSDIESAYYNREFDDEFVKNHPDLIEYFSNTDIAYGFKKDFKWLLKIQAKSGLKQNNIDKLRVLEFYNKIDDKSLQDIFVEFVQENIDIAVNRLEETSELLYKLSFSNSQEVFTFRKELAKQLLGIDDPIEGFNKVEKMFIENNLPIHSKLYGVFNILHPGFYGFDFSEQSIMSPVLINSTVKEREVLIQKDLFKASLLSNNRSLRDFLNVVEIGSDVFEHQELLTEVDERIIVKFRNSLVSLYELQGKEFTSSGDVLEDIRRLKNSFAKGGDMNYKLSDRVVELLSFGLFSTLDELKEFKKNSIEEADKRNRGAIYESDYSRLVEGDLVKGVGSTDYLSNILQNGSVSKEFLGVSAGSDYTPLDTDLSLITSASMELSSTISNAGASSYGGGGLYFILKNRDGRFNVTRTHSGDANLPEDDGKLELFRTGGVNTDNSQHYGIRTGFPSTDIDYIVLRDRQPIVFLEIAMNGFYIPVINMEGKIIFTPKDYDELRSKMSGLSHYETGDYIFSENLVTPEITEIAEQVERNDLDTKYKKDKIVAIIKSVLDEMGLSLKEYIDGDLTPGSVELVDTGSTGRGTNKIGDGDFDFMMRVDRVLLQNPTKMQELKSKLISKFSGHENEVIGTGDFRLKNVVLDDVILDIDITFTEKTDKVTYSTDMALVDRFSNIKRVDPEKYNYVIANILLAKNVLKEAGAYKPNRGEVPQGGLGGVGIENWILQYGGSFYDAAQAFLRVAQGKDFAEFRECYQVFDFGENHLSQRRNVYLHDNFVFNNMSAEGYLKMRDALNQYIYEVDYCTRKTSSLN